jgi:hypothetical protein
MKKLAWILGLIALCASIFVAVSGFVAFRGARRASVAVGKAQAELSDWQTVAALELRNHSIAVENDELALSSDDIEIQLAKQEGRSTAKAEAQLSSDQMVLISDRSTQSLDDLNGALGPDPRVSSSMERVQAAQLSLSIYSAVLSRDEHLAYATAVVWLAFGFAVAFATKQRGLQRTEQ